MLFWLVTCCLRGSFFVGRSKNSFYGVDRDSAEGDFRRRKKIFWARQEKREGVKEEEIKNSKEIVNGKVNTRKK